MDYDSSKEVSRDPYKGRFFKKSVPFQLNEEQQLAFDRVKEESIDPHNSKVYLLEGVYWFWENGGLFAMD